MEHSEDTVHTRAAFDGLLQKTDFLGTEIFTP